VPKTALPYVPNGELWQSGVFWNSYVKGSDNPVALAENFAQDMQLVKLYLEMEKVKSRMWFFHFKDS
jgi:uncharacterized membrane protein